MSGAGQEMREGRNRSGKTKLRANEVGAQMSVRTLEGSGGVAKIRSEGERAQEFESATDFKSIQVKLRRGDRDGAPGSRTGTLWGLRESDWRANVGIATKEFKTLRV